MAAEQRPDDKDQNRYDDKSVMEYLILMLSQYIAEIKEWF
jgi:hypothetical protein